MPQRSADELVKLLDEGVSETAEEELVALGEESLDAILNSVSTINDNLKFGRDYCSNVNALEKRVRVLGRLKNQDGLRAVFDALADSATAVRELKDQSKHTIGYDAQLYLDSRIVAAESLNRTAIDALIAFGGVTVPHIERYLKDDYPTEVKRALIKALGKLNKQWWQFWK